MAMKRRDFLQATLVTAGSILVPSCTEEQVETGACLVQDGTAFFPQSVASGDPRPDSVVLWTRLEDPAVTGDLSVQLKVALDPEFTQVVALVVDTDIHAIVDDAAGAPLASLLAQEAFDHCVKVKVAGLQPRTTYYYQFYYGTPGGCYASRVGRTKTAPAEDYDSPKPVRFAYVSCQDFIGRYYNAYLALAQEELDFFIVLGDYIYETTGDPTFQDPASARKVVLTDTEGAIQFMTSDMQPYYAAQSLDNYREIYRTYRSDPALQAMHEKFPMIAIWDDHEYSDDCHGATASYYDGRQDEMNVDRRKAANKAWFEYQPADLGDDFHYDETVEYPQDITIYRDFKFGKHLHLVLTDLRTYRADHLVPEEAFPGKVAVNEAALTAGGQPIPPQAMPYVNIDDVQWAAHKSALIAAADTEGYDPAVVTGDISVAFINGIIDKLSLQETPIDPMQAGLLKGISYIDVSKLGYYSSIGSRYFLAKEEFDILGERQYTATGGASEVMMGSEQESWFLDTMTNSTQTWKVWANEYCLTQLAVDLTSQPIPDQFKKRFYMNCDAWDGFRNKRSELIAALSAIPNVVAVTGDIHAFYASTPMVNNDPTKKIVEFVGSSITSKTFKDELLSQVQSDPVLSQVDGAEQLAAFIDTLLLNKLSQINPHLGFANSSENGFCVVDVAPEELIVTMHQIQAQGADVDAEGNPVSVVSVDYTGREAELAALITQTRFKTIIDEHELYMDDNGTWKRWDPATQEWI